MSTTRGHRLDDGPPSKPDREPDDDPYWVSTLVVERECDGWRLDRYLTHKIPRLSRSRLQSLLATQVSFVEAEPDVPGPGPGPGPGPDKAGSSASAGKVVRPAQSSNKKVAEALPPWVTVGTVKPARIVRAGQGIVFRRPKRPEPEAPRDFAILYDDGQVMAIDKPAGLPMHPTARYYTSTLTAILRERFSGQALHIAHRLDRETSGVLLLGRGTEASRGLKMRFARRQVHKRYLALVHGEVEAPSDVIDLPLVSSLGPLKNAMEVHDPVEDIRPALPAQTRYHVLLVRGGYSLVSLEPVTGRQHQLRVHLAAIGHPIVGDKLYGADPSLFVEYCEHGFTERLKQALPMSRQALHASELWLNHPLTGEPLVVHAPLPADMKAFLGGLGCSSELLAERMRAASTAEVSP